MNEKMELLEVILSDRVFLYSLLHKVFGREPDAALLDILTSKDTADGFALYSAEEGDPLDLAGRFFDEVRADCADAAFLDRVKSEYTRFFIGPLDLVAPPWESIYRGKAAALFQESTLEVRNFYRSFHLLPEGYPRVADDSLALELAFMAKLAERGLNALRSGDTKELSACMVGSADFLKAHLLVWVPKFFERMKNAETDYLYPQMSLLLYSFLLRDAEVLQEDVLPALQG